MIETIRRGVGFRCGPIRRGIRIRRGITPFLVNVTWGIVTHVFVVLDVGFSSFLNFSYWDFSHKQGRGLRLGWMGFWLGWVRGIEG